MIARSLFSYVILLGVFSLLLSQASATNGEKWTKLDKTAKFWLLEGFLDGQQFGVKFCQGEGDKEYQERVAKTFNAMKDRYWAKIISHDTIIVGLDEFYKDYRNRHLDLHWGVFVVLAGRSGWSEEALEKLILSIRKEAAAEQASEQQPNK